MGKSPVGNELILSGDIQALTNLQIACNGITLRSGQGNNIIYLYDASGAVKIGYLLQGESISLDAISPHRVLVQGTVGQKLYWMGVTI